MKTLLVVLTVVGVGILGWLYWDYRSVNPEPVPSSLTALDDLSSTDTPSPTPLMLDVTPAPIVTPIPSTPRPTATPTPTPSPRITGPIFVSMNAQNSSGQFGTAAIVTTENGKAAVGFNLVGGPVGIYQAAYIYSGTCAGLGSTRYNLNPLMNGSSYTVLNVDIDTLMRTEGHLAIVVYESHQGFLHPFSCGQIK